MNQQGSCCADEFCTGVTGACCNTRAQMPCSTYEDCCVNGRAIAVDECNGGKCCQPTGFTHIANACLTDGDCCDANAVCITQNSLYVGECCSPVNGSCSDNTDCCSAKCSQGKCICSPTGMSCTRDADCCLGPCMGGTCQ